MDSEPGTENAVFDLQLVESADEKPGGIHRADCTFIGKISTYKWTYTVQTSVVQGSTVLCTAAGHNIKHTGFRDTQALCYYL